MAIEWELVKYLRYHFADLEYPNVDCSGRTVIVTGASGGLGLEAARHFTRLNAEKVILACRNLEKAEKAKADIEKSITTNKPGVVEVWQLDLCSFDSIKDFCQRANTSLRRLDILMANAAVATQTYRCLEGYEETITVNVLSTFMMALLLLPLMRRTAATHNVLPHAVFVSSDAHYMTSLPQRHAPGGSIFDALRGSDGMLSRYYVSKLLVVLVARELAAAVDEGVAKGRPRVIINSLSPGFCNTEIFRYAPWPLPWILGFVARFVARSTEMGSRTMLAAAFAGEETHGRYMGDCKVHTESAFARSEEGRRAGKRAYDELLGILEASSPGISANI